MIAQFLTADYTHCRPGLRKQDGDWPPCCRFTASCLPEPLVRLMWFTTFFLWKNLKKQHMG